MTVSRITVSEGYPPLLPMFGKFPKQHLSLAWIERRGQRVGSRS
jgi:hypothetical protein